MKIFDFQDTKNTLYFFVYKSLGNITFPKDLYISIQNMFYIQSLKGGLQL